MKRFLPDTFEDFIINILGFILIVLAVVIVIAMISLMSEFSKRNSIVQECLKSEQYTRDECITLAGGSK